MLPPVISEKKTNKVHGSSVAMGTPIVCGGDEAYLLASLPWGLFLATKVVELGEPVRCMQARHNAQASGHRHLHTFLVASSGFKARLEQPWEASRGGQSEGRPGPAAFPRRNPLVVAVLGSRKGLGVFQVARKLIPCAHRSVGVHAAILVSQTHGGVLC